MTAQAATPPPTGGRAARFGFIRPETDRKIAGVGAAFGRATGTDPLLWRVLLAVFTVFAGAGLVLYLLCWLLFPAEGDETSPVGSLMSSKSSSTSVFITLLLGLGAGLLGIVTFVSTHGRPFLLFALVAALVIVLARRSGDRPPPAQPPPPPPPDDPPAPQYTAPFAPHGPYADRTLELPSGPAAGPAPPRSEARAPRSSLGVVTFCLVVIELGLAAIAGMLGAPLDPVAVLAVALLLCGGGLLLGAWWGRGRGLIALGLVLAAAMALTSMFDGERPVSPFPVNGTSVDAPHGPPAGEPPESPR